MQYTVITKQGKIKQFYIREVAENYRVLHGGVVITPQILVDNTVQSAV